MRSLCIIIPVKDEEKGLEYLLKDFQSSKIKQEYKVDFIFVIDERTSDNSREIAKQFSKQIIDQKDTYGKGDAIRKAVSYWKENCDDDVVFLDADGSYSFEGVREIVLALQEGADVVSGSRFLRKKGKPSGMSILHNFGNKSLSFVSSIRNKRRISDLCTGLWGFKSEALKEIQIRSNGFDLEAELASQARKKKLVHREIPVRWSQRKGGVSKLRSLRDGVVIFIRIILG